MEDSEGVRGVTSNLPLKGLGLKRTVSFLAVEIFMV